ncbi:hypothetical protein GBA52_015248 [Prunus armeniaca]|nr:hypothetical protein GBA52_015248 [Prunus armeniaca]
MLVLTISLLTSSPLVATKEASADSSPSQSEKRPLPSTQGIEEDRNSSSYDVKIPQVDEPSLPDRERSRGTHCPQDSGATQPHSLDHGHSLSRFFFGHSESCIPIFEAEVGGQTVTSKAKVEKEVIGSNPSTNPDVSMAETQHVTQPLGSREFDCGVVDDPSHILDHQIVSLSLETTSVGPTTVREEVQILLDHTSYP